MHLQHDMVVCAELFAKARPRRARERSILQRAEVVLRLRPRQRRVLSAGGRRHQHPLARSAIGGECVRRRSNAIVRRCFSRCRLATPCSSPTKVRSICRACGSGPRPAKHCRRRSTIDSSSASAIDILDGIGSTEALHTFISNRPGVIRPGSSGLVVPGYEAKLIDESGLPVQPGEIGNLWIARRLGVLGVLESAREDQADL